MQWAPGGRGVTGQDLAARAGISKQKVSAMLCGERTTVTPEVAHRIADILGVHQGALFFDPPPTPMGVGELRRDPTHEHQRPLDAHAVRSAQELEQHPRQGEPYRSRPPR
ncbi:helix-turn-helix domain-containing protein [Streptomyces sp. NPDC087428]|uniref:helix-turn-helix domain-containing protein n=1 Tax=Streptomyces sp. NPDC087428 TaxID=3365788 RepID=UPI0037F4B24B